MAGEESSLALFVCVRAKRETTMGNIRNFPFEKGGKKNLYKRREREGRPFIFGGKQQEKVLETREAFVRAKEEECIELMSEECRQKNIKSPRWRSFPFAPPFFAKKKELTNHQTLH
jgi:hypothetical protein